MKKYTNLTIVVFTILLCGAMWLLLAYSLFTIPTCSIGEEEIKNTEEYEVEDEDDNIELALIEQGYYRDDIPLSYEEQDYLQTACDEFGVDYALMLGLIEQETNFQNLVGDNGASEGYCQCQRRWWKDLMEEIDAEDLMNPYDNFRTSCAILTYLYDKYENWTDTLTAYNTGSGGNSKYAASVLKNMENWQKVLDN